MSTFSYRDFFFLDKHSSHSCAYAGRLCKSVCQLCRFPSSPVFLLPHWAAALPLRQLKLQSTTRVPRWGGGMGAHPKPSCLQTTSASASSHWSSHTVPHWPAWYTSTLPSYLEPPPDRRTGTNAAARARENEQPMTLSRRTLTMERKSWGTANQIKAGRYMGTSEQTDLLGVQ